LLLRLLRRVQLRLWLLPVHLSTGEGASPKLETLARELTAEFSTPFAVRRDALAEGVAAHLLEGGDGASWAAARAATTREPVTSRQSGKAATRRRGDAKAPAWRFPRGTATAPRS
jgi:hypothetical protein